MNQMSNRTQVTSKTNTGQIKRYRGHDFDDSLIPTPEEWEWITSDEPELSFYRDQIRKNGKINEEI